MLTLGSLRQIAPASGSYSIHARKTGNNVDLIFKNTTQAPKTKSDEKVITADLRPEIRIRGQVGDTRSSSRNLEVSSTPKEGGLRFAMTFGAKVASFDVMESAFRKPQ